ncbi:hypothetical protein MSAN_02396500 [Mycena sanguinolenta]|uniref:Uncharacterized protein n=1 Tax=Mycena sanguinolenta TaxID=230812 RepID=A0A8H6X4N4_9AGAR|nr:hypothetical protein MSAN_02396500 [Mycena sanguinolenta]
MIHTSYGRSLLSAVLCICCSQTFVDASARELRFAPAFAVALEAYVGSTTEAAVVAEIRKITDSTYPPQPASPPFPVPKNMSTWFPEPVWLKKRKELKRKEREKREERKREERKERQRQALIDVIKTYRLRFHEEREAQMERVNPL